MTAPMQRSATPPPVSARRMGLALAAIFSWLLAFPLFGPVLFQIAGAGAPKQGLLFAFAHGAGLLGTAVLPPARVGVRSWLTGAGLMLATATVAYPLWPGAGPLLMALIGVAAGYLVASWCSVFRQTSASLTALVIGMTVANGVAATVNLPWSPGQSPFLLLIILATLVLAGALAIPPLTPWAGGAPAVPLPLRAVIGAPWFLPLAAFALADYVVGGIWYQMLPPFAPERWPQRLVLEPLVYVAGIFLFAYRARRSPPGALARYSLSLLGLGLLVAATQLGYAAALASQRGLLLLGLAAGDLYFWLQLTRVNQEYHSHRPMAVGLGLSLWLIALATAAPAVLGQWVAGSDRLFVLAGAGLIFMVIPLVFSERRTEGRPGIPQTPTEPGAAVAAASTPAPGAPEGLTQTERQVWDLLITGASDADIAAALTITRHTVKFHVRNILHKAGAANRKELLSLLLRQK